MTGWEFNLCESIILFTLGAIPAILVSKWNCWHLITKPACHSYRKLWSENKWTEWQLVQSHLQNTQYTCTCTSVLAKWLIDLLVETNIFFILCSWLASWFTKLSFFGFSVDLPSWHIWHMNVLPSSLWFVFNHWNRINHSDLFFLFCRGNIP